MSFSQLGLCDPLLKSIKEKGYSSPSPIQQEAIPAILPGRDVLAALEGRFRPADLESLRDGLNRLVRWRDGARPS